MIDLNQCCKNQVMPIIYEGIVLFELHGYSLFVLVVVKK
ncbi:Unknown protein sequence [Pseudomonas amygdali pv. lachrymans]|uniref:Uncharacterized protein n=1 Tax=Pseudomonas amygdali pv. lachrymans TaxID=53707 RepID=A0ABR5KS29_PSEAV|nr:Unknown protein sequence [Pseudomonas amygdali pv. lachrymans]